MEDDLKMAAPLGQPQPAGQPIPPSKKEEPKKAAALAKQIFKQAEEAYRKNFYSEASGLCQKIIQEKTTSWLLRFKTKRLIKKIQKKLAKEAKQKLLSETAKQKQATIPPKAAPKPLTLPPPPQQKIHPPAAPEAIKTAPPPFLPVRVPRPAPAPPLTLPAAPAPLPPAAAPKETLLPSPAPTPKISYKDFLPSAAALPVVKTVNPFRLYFVLGSLLIILAVVLGYFFWRTPSPLEPSLPKPPLPSPLFSMDRATVLEIRESDIPLLPEKIEALAEKTQPAGSFINLVFKKINGEVSYLDFGQILNGLNIPAPTLECAGKTGCVPNAGLLDNVTTDKFSLFLYYQKEGPSDLFSPAAKPARLGIVAKLKNATTAKEILSQSEPNLTEIFDPLLMGKKPAAAPEEVFKNNTYKDAAIRYVNLPDKYLSIDYAIFGDWLIIATSKESALAALDKIKNEQPSEK